MSSVTPLITRIPDLLNRPSGLRDGPVTSTSTAGINIMAVNAGSWSEDLAALAGSLFALVVDVFEVERMDVARDVTMNEHVNTNPESFWRLSHSKYGESADCQR
jgi:hypothetical protein